MSEDKDKDKVCGRKCGSDDGAECVMCDVHLLCHLCVETELLAEVEQLKALIEAWQRVATAYDACITDSPVATPEGRELAHAFMVALTLQRKLEGRE